MAIATNAVSPLAIPALGGSDTQVVHPSVIDSVEVTGITWNGYRYWMAITPYPDSNDNLENPCILASNDKVTWVVPEGLTNPIDTTPSTTGRHNSDTELLLEPDGSFLHCFYREAGTSTNKEEYIYVRSSSDGITWSSETLIISTGVTTDDQLFLSPAVVKAGSTYHMYAVRGSGRGIDYRTATSVTGPWSSQQLLDQGEYGGLEPWHISARLEKNGALRFILHVTPGGGSTEGELWIAETAGVGKDLVGVAALLTPSASGWDANLYRASAIPLTAVGEYGLYYSARGPAGAWRTGYTEFTGPAPLYTETQAGTSKTIEFVDNTQSFEVRVQGVNAGAAGPWSAWQTVGGGTDALTANDISSTSEVSSPTIAQTHALTANDVSSLSSVTNPALTSSATSDNLQADDIQSATGVTNPSIGQVHAITAQSVESATQVSSPSISQTHAITANNIESLTQTSNPAIQQVHDLFALSVESDSQISVPNFTATDTVEHLTADNVEANSETSSPAIGQVHNLLAEDIESQSEVTFFGALPSINGVRYIEGGIHPKVQAKVRLFIRGTL